jgi:hypothetical protein
MTSLQAQKQFFSEEIRMCANVRTGALVEALSTVARERFLPHGPWAIRGEGEVGPARQTPDADPRRVYHNISIAIDQTVVDHQKTYLFEHLPVLRTSTSSAPSARF